MTVWLWIRWTIFDWHKTSQPNNCFWYDVRNIRFSKYKVSKSRRCIHYTNPLLYMVVDWACMVVLSTTNPLLYMVVDWPCMVVLSFGHTDHSIIFNFTDRYENEILKSSPNDWLKSVILSLFKDELTAELKIWWKCIQKVSDLSFPYLGQMII